MPPHTQRRAGPQSMVLQAVKARMQSNVLHLLDACVNLAVKALWHQLANLAFEYEQHLQMSACWSHTRSGCPGTVVPSPTSFALSHYFRTGQLLHCTVDMQFLPALGLVQMVCLQAGSMTASTSTWAPRRLCMPVAGSIDQLIGLKIQLLPVT